MGVRSTTGVTALALQAWVFGRWLTAGDLRSAPPGDLHNDLYSLSKEESGADPHNLLLILQRTDGADLDDASTSVLGMLHARIARFRSLESALRASEGTALDRYLRDALHTVMRGPYDWAPRSGRYGTSLL
ncbi:MULTISPECIES: hypothetical protein [unclassified Streptomyces]|uniref:terpene synthase family protein n=1 Tax=unclassified Streptomyces TaxID=2593676 RepID=UPI003664C30C